MNWQDFEHAIEHAKEEIRKGDQAAARLARLMRHRLRTADIDTETLRAFKRELQDFDSRTGHWKK